MSDTCYPLVIICCLKYIRFIIHNHGAKFQTSKRFVAQSATLLPEQDRASGSQLDGCSQYHIKEREQRADEGERDHHVKKTFQNHIVQSLSGTIKIGYIQGLLPHRRQEAPLLPRVGVSLWSPV